VQFSIIFAVAREIRLCEQLPFFKIAFLQSLALVQFLGMIAVVLASGVAMPKPRDSWRMTTLYFLYINSLLLRRGLAGILTNSAGASKFGARVDTRLFVGMVEFGQDLTS
jgi:hypothetical protein